MTVVYEDNHLLIVSKAPGEIVQGDKTGDTPLVEQAKEYLREKYHKPGNVFLGVVHRVDRPVAGLVIFAKTSKALARLNTMFAEGQVRKTYWAVVEHTPPQQQGTLCSWLVRDEQNNKSIAYNHEVPGAKMALMEYTVLAKSADHSVVAVLLLTGRHHQIRCQLASIGCPIVYDVKYGATTRGGNGSIALCSRQVQFLHPVSHEEITCTAPLPATTLWHKVQALLAKEGQ